MNMSDPVTNVEIEDVLSSIRKLVSNRPQQEEGAKGAADTADDDRLVLSPSLRVDDEPESGAEDRPDHDETAAVSPESDETARHDQIDGEYSSDAAERDAAPPAAGEYGHEAETEAGPETALDPEPDATETAADEADDDGSGGAGDIWQEADEAAPETSGTVAADPDNAEQPPDEMPESETHPAATQDDRSEDGTEAAGRTQEAVAALRQVSTLEERVAGFEAAINARDDQWEPDGTSDDAYSGSDVAPLPWEDHAAEMPQGKLSDDTTTEETGDIADVPEAEHIEEVFAEEVETGDWPTDEGAPDTLAAAAGDDLLHLTEEAVLDEDMLRDMVAEIVRQELQGTLGERITRNVRKLVRREIHRALASQDFE